jgi:deoxyribodipyrimidine photo-lyase
VFNPTLQAERFDKEANYIQRWVPELRGLKAKDTFEPTKRLGSGKVRKMGYYAPIVDHVTARKRAIAAFKDNAGKEEGEEKPSKKAKTS